MVDDGLNAFLGLDVALARAMIGMDEVARLDRSICDEWTARVLADPGQIGAAFLHLSASRHLQRIAGYATNVAERVVYLKEGSIIHHQNGDNLEATAEGGGPRGRSDPRN